MGKPEYSDLEKFDDERSLNSSTRRRVLLYMYVAGKKVTAYDIARSTEISYPNVRGALSGLHKRFSWLKSLVCRGMVVEEHDSSGLTIYSLTDKGYELARSLNTDKDRFEGTAQPVRLERTLENQQ